MASVATATTLPSVTDTKPPSSSGTKSTNKSTKRSKSKSRSKSPDSKRSTSKPRTQLTDAQRSEKLSELGTQTHWGDFKEKLESFYSSAQNSDERRYFDTQVSRFVSRVLGKNKVPTALRDLRTYDDTKVSTTFKATATTLNDTLMQHKNAIRTAEVLTGGGVSSGIAEAIEKDDRFKRTAASTASGGKSSKGGSTGVGTASTGVGTAPTQGSDPEPVKKRKMSKAERIAAREAQLKAYKARGEDQTTTGTDGDTAPTGRRSISFAPEATTNEGTSAPITAPLDTATSPASAPPATTTPPPTTSPKAKELTPLQKKLAEMSTDAGKASMLAALKSGADGKSTGATMSFPAPTTTGADTTVSVPAPTDEMKEKIKAIKAKMVEEAASQAATTAASGTAPTTGAATATDPDAAIKAAKAKMLARQKKANDETVKSFGDLTDPSNMTKFANHVGAGMSSALESAVGTAKASEMAKQGEELIRSGQWATTVKDIGKWHELRMKLHNDIKTVGWTNNGGTEMRERTEMLDGGEFGTLRQERKWDAQSNAYTGMTVTFTRAEKTADADTQALFDFGTTTGAPSGQSGMSVMSGPGTSSAANEYKKSLIDTARKNMSQKAKEQGQGKKPGKADRKKEKSAQVSSNGVLSGMATGASDALSRLGNRLGSLGGSLISV